jgi:hypothetical protein
MREGEMLTILLLPKHWCRRWVKVAQSGADIFAEKHSFLFRFIPAITTIKERNQKQPDKMKKILLSALLAAMSVGLIAQHSAIRKSSADVKEGYTGLNLLPMANTSIYQDVERLQVPKIHI